MTERGDPALVVFTRAPIAGQVKTRLCEGSSALTAEQAARLHTAFVRDVCTSGARAGFVRRRLYVAGELAHPQLLEIASEQGFVLRAQQGADLGARMAAAIADELLDGASSVVLIGTDSPTLPADYLRQAAAFLHGPAAVVLGPAADGGYYLIGARQPIPTLFTPGMAWSTEQVLPATLLRLAELRAVGLPVALLPFFYDVDTLQDLRLLVAHLRLFAATDGKTGAVDVDGSLLLTDAGAPATGALLHELGWL